MADIGFDKLYFEKTRFPFYNKMKILNPKYFYKNKKRNFVRKFNFYYPQKMYKQYQLTYQFLVFTFLIVYKK